jgi:hypothetical protein
MVPSWCFEQNLQLSYDLFQNNISNNLSMHNSEANEIFAAREQEGSQLIFILMMNHFWIDLEEAIPSLNEHVKKFSMQLVPGKTIYRVVSLLQAAVKRLQQISKLPKGMVWMLINVFTNPMWNGKVAWSCWLVWKVSKQEQLCCSRVCRWQGLGIL